MLARAARKRRDRDDAAGESEPFECVDRHRRRLSGGEQHGCRLGEARGDREVAEVDEGHRRRCAVADEHAGDAAHRRDGAGERRDEPRSAQGVLRGGDRGKRDGDGRAGRCDRARARRLCLHGVRRRGREHIGAGGVTSAAGGRERLALAHRAGALRIRRIGDRVAVGGDPVAAGGDRLPVGIHPRLGGRDGAARVAELGSVAGELPFVGGDGSLVVEDRLRIRGESRRVRSVVHLFLLVGEQLCLVGGGPRAVVRDAARRGRGGGLRARERSLVIVECRLVVARPRLIGRERGARLVDGRPETGCVDARRGPCVPQCALGARRRFAGAADADALLRPLGGREPVLELQQLRPRRGEPGLCARERALGRGLVEPSKQLPLAHGVAGTDVDLDETAGARKAERRLPGRLDGSVRRERRRDRRRARRAEGEQAHDDGGGERAPTRPCHRCDPADRGCSARTP